MQMYSCSHTHTHALPSKSLLHHLLTHIHVFLSPAAHQGLGKLPGMKEICSLMAPFSCIWWHKAQLEVLSAAKEKVWLYLRKRKKLISDRVVCPESPLFHLRYF